MRVLGQQAQRIAALEHHLENLAGLALAADAGQRVDAPEGADVEGRLGLAEIVRRFITAHVGAIAQRLLEGVDGGHEARVVRVDEIHFGHQQRAGVEVAPAETFGERLALIAPGFAQDPFPDDVGAPAPVTDALGHLQRRRGLGQPVAGGPAHESGRGVDTAAGTQLPHAGVGLVVKAKSLFTHRFEVAEFGLAGTAKQPLVVERLRSAQHDVAVHVVLEMLLRLVAQPHRPLAAVARQVAQDRFGQLFLLADAVQRLDMAAARPHHNVVEPAQVVLHRADLGQAVERAHDKKRIAQPAVAVIPVAPAVRGFRDAGGHGRDDGAGVFAQRHFQRDGGADHGLLPLQRQCQRARPAAPVAGGLQLELAGGVVDAAHQRLVRTQNEIERPVDHETGFAQDVIDRSVGCESQHLLPADIADVGAALGQCRRHPAPVEARPQQHPAARHAGQHLHPPHQCEWPEHPVVAGKARREIGDLDGLATAVVQPGAQDRGVGLVGLFAAGEILQLESPVAAVLACVEQGVEDRIAVETRQAAPDDARTFVDQRAVGAVADHAEVQRRRGRLDPAAHDPTLAARAAIT